MTSIGSSAWSSVLTTISRSRVIRASLSLVSVPCSAAKSYDLLEHRLSNRAKFVSVKFCLRPATRMLEKDGEAIALTTGEFAVLHALVSHPRETLSRERLLSLARGRQRNAFDRSIDVQMSRLRRLIEVDPAKPRYLQTVWGAGYVFVPDEPA